MSKVEKEPEWMDGAYESEEGELRKQWERPRGTGCSNEDIFPGSRDIISGESQCPLYKVHTQMPRQVMFTTTLFPFDK